MSSKLTRTIIGALVAIALAVAVSYGLISQQTADQIQTQADQTLANGGTSQQPVPQQPAPQSPAPAQPGPGQAAPAQRP